MAVSSVIWLLGIIWRSARALVRRLRRWWDSWQAYRQRPSDAFLGRVSIAWYLGDDLSCRRCGETDAGAGQLWACPHCGFAGSAFVDEGPPLTAVEIGALRELAAVFTRSFCGKCTAGPDYPLGRCPSCLELLDAVLHLEKARGPT